MLRLRKSCLQWSLWCRSFQMLQASPGPQALQKRLKRKFSPQPAWSRPQPVLIYLPLPTRSVLPTYKGTGTH